MIGTRGRHPNNKEERWRRECIRRGNVKHAALMLHDDQTARKAKRAKLEKLLRERWEARHNDGAPGSSRPTEETSSTACGRGEPHPSRPAGGTSSTACGGPPSPEGKAKGFPSGEAGRLRSRLTDEVSAPGAVSARQTDEVSTDEEV